MVVRTRSAEASRLWNYFEYQLVWHESLNRRSGKLNIYRQGHLEVQTNGVAPALLGTCSLPAIGVWIFLPRSPQSVA
jgi:hypothetical protein